MAMRRLGLVRDVLDKQLVDREDIDMGRADGVILEVRDGAPPRIDHLELGFVVLARRFHPRVERWLEAIRERWSVRRSARQIVPWSKVIEVDQHHVKLDLEAGKTPAFDWERWLRKNIVTKLPGGQPE
jgi:hypothetical protein